MKLRIAVLLLLALAWAGTAIASQEPMEAGVQHAQLCKPDDIDAVSDFLGLPDLELKAGNDEPGRSTLVAAACKADPVKPGQTIVAVAYDAGVQYSKALVIAMLDNRRQQVLASYRGEIGEDAAMTIQEGSLWIDTANYALADSVQAFAVDVISGYSPNCGDGGLGASRSLYVRDGKRLRPVLTDLTMQYWQFISRGNDRCNSMTPPDTQTITGYTTLSLAMATTVSHGYHDLIVTALFSRDDNKPVHNYDNNPCGLTPFHYRLHYDGKEYRRDGFDQALHCGDRWSPVALIVKSAVSAPDSAKATPVNFLPSMQVVIMDSRPGSVLVRRFDNQEQVGWVPREAVVWLTELAPIHTWHGPATFQMDTKEGYESHRTYHFQADGSYTVELQLGKSAPVQRKGYLYTYGPVILASGIEDSAYLWLQDSGHLCALTSSGACAKP